MRHLVLYLVRMFASRGVPMMRLVIGKRFGKGVRMLYAACAARRQRQRHHDRTNRRKHGRSVMFQISPHDT